MLFKKRFRQAACVFAALLTGTLLGCAVLSDMNPEPIHTPIQTPGHNHLLGTDNSGRDILSLMIQSTWISLSIGLGSAFLAVFIGASVGCIAGYFRSPVDDLLMRLTDIVLLVPTLPLIIVLSAYIGPGVIHAALVIALTAWPATARVIYAHVLKLREEPFVINAKSMGAGSIYLMFRHILPNCTELLLAKAALTVAGAMLAEAGISFLGLGDPVHTTWGSMLHDAFVGAALINGCWWWILPPVLCISGSVGLFNVTGHFLSGATASANPADTPETFSSADCCDQADTPVSSLLSIRSLCICFSGSAGPALPVVNKLDLDVSAGEKVAVIGATGSGKSLLLLALLGLLPAGAKVSGSIFIEGKNLSAYSASALRRHRGVFAGYVPQGLGNALNPVLTVGFQVAERNRVHRGFDRTGAFEAALSGLFAVGLPDPDKRISDYPHHLSGGMKQRVLLAEALSVNPSLILADEPTKGLDHSAAAEIMELIKGLHTETVLAMTHDLIFARALGGRILVMLAGVVVEEAPADSFFRSPLHPYSRALIAAQPSQSMKEIAGFHISGIMTDGSGCPYRQECLIANRQCEIRPPLRFLQGHKIRCWHDVA